MGWVPVSWFSFNLRSFKFANWPSSAGMGPGDKTVKSYKNKPFYPSGTKMHKESKPILHIEDLTLTPTLTLTLTPSLTLILTLNLTLTLTLLLALYP